MARLEHGRATGYHSAEGLAFGDQPDGLAAGFSSGVDQFACTALGFAGGHGLGVKRGAILVHRNG